jgi:hypothetical protein
LTPELEIMTPKEIPKKCIVENCNENPDSLGYCNRHYRQYKKYNKTLERTRFDKNNFVEYQLYYEMILYNKKGEEINRTKISKCDYDDVKKYKWYYGKSTGYVYGHVNKKRVSLHRYIMKAKENEIPDHYNRDKLDNRRENLNIVDFYINSWNSLSIRTEDYIRGVNYNSRDNVWRARLRCKGQLRLDESFVDREKAIIARLKAEKEYYGEFAPQRHLFEKYNISKDITYKN